jgi:putative FmdB family regulatory protein
MPIYEYRCHVCNKDFEYLVFRDQEAVECPSCKSPDVDRLMSACGFVSKGSGGETVSSSASVGSSCGGCHASSCAGCGH